LKLARTAKSARQCVVVGSRVRALKSGSCVVRVTVTTGKKSVSRSITLTVA
jgi:mRNA-degrading endonuclease toxin of MazEF toxin-antitoxin module